MAQRVKKTRNRAIRFDAEPGKIKIARYVGDVTSVTIHDGCATVCGYRYFVSDNFPNGSVLSINIVDTRTGGVYPSLLVRDVLRYGSNDLSAVPFSARHELLDLLCTSLYPDMGFALFGGRCVSPYVYVAIPVTFSLALKCNDDRLLGVTLYDGSSVEHGVDTPLESSDDVDHGEVTKFPPVPDESKRVLTYKPLIQSMIRKMSGKWKDVYLKNHTPGQLPYSAEDLMQHGLMEAVIAIRKYDSKHKSKAKEFTFVYRHLWNRFGHIAHKYSKKSRGYGVHLVRDFIDDDGNFTSAYDLGQERDYV